MAKVRVALAGVGNCASALIQGVNFYSKRPRPPDEEIVGLTAFDIGGITPADIEIVAAFDVNRAKVGRDLSEAIFAKPNNTVKITDVPKLGVKVQRAPALDGIGKYLKEVVKISDEPEVPSVAQAIRDSGAEILINYLPVGSTKAVEFYANEAIKAHAAFINAMPVFIASEPSWQSKFVEAGLPTAGDDVMSQLGATVLHKTIVKLCVDRGVRVDETYQLNIGGDADFLNMLEESRLVDKRISKTSAVRAMSPYEVPTRIGPSDYVPFLDNDKICYVWLKGRYFGNIPLTIDLKLHVIDAYDSAGVMVDAVRGVKIGLDRGVSGPLESISAYCFKHPPVQMPYNEAKQAFLAFVQGKKER
ncbi:MAG TPA: inositol-3-phosphate synthase [Nitrososphaerales archaeon]|nr:inositol-3-phosphate synthase [Nitrososphaerales archaeon]